MLSSFPSIFIVLCFIILLPFYAWLYLLRVYAHEPLNHLVRDSKPKTMAPPYSTELCWHIAWLVVTHQVSLDVVSWLLNVSACTVARQVDLFLQMGHIAPKTHCYGPTRQFSHNEQLILLWLILKNPGIYLKPQTSSEQNSLIFLKWR